jgi:23S rRNA pseudouridine2605 synthase
VVTELGTQADARHDVIAVDGERLPDPGAARTICLHKPRGVLTTLHDPSNRPTVAALLGGVGERLFPVGRLDMNTTGLLLLTNDGALAAALTHPRHEVLRVYQAKVRGGPSEAAITRLRRGVRLDDGRKTAPAKVHVLERLPTKTWLEIGVREGRWRLVRRMCDAVGHPVEKLARVRLGPLTLDDLPPGAWRDLTRQELNALRAAVGLGRAAGRTGVRAGRRRARGTSPTTRRRRGVASQPT